MEYLFVYYFGTDRGQNACYLVAPSPGLVSLDLVQEMSAEEIGQLMGGN